MALFAALQSGQQRSREGKPLPLSRATGDFVFNDAIEPR